MALNMRRSVSVKLKGIATAVAVLAIIAQPVYGFVVGQVAEALVNSKITVTANGQGGWQFNRDASTSSPYSFTNTVHTAGAGSLSVAPIGANPSDKFVAENTINTPISDLKSIAYDFRVAGNGTAASANQFYLNVYATFTNSGAYYNCRFDYAPTVGSTTKFTEAAFATTDTPVNVRASAGAVCPPTLAGMATGSYVRAFAINVGDTTAGDTGLAGYLDNVKVKTAAGTTTSDFEAISYTPTAPPVRPALSGDVIYDSIPTVLPSNSPSIGYQATSTKALGDKITFAGSGRTLDKIAVNLSSWACQTGTWNNNCVTTPGATFTHPVTVNVYNVASDGSVGSLIDSRTQSFAIPYRPTADPTCGSATQWRDTAGNCFNGINHVVTFDASGITVPNTIIYSVSYNTQSYGTNPIGVDGPYSSLNFALSSVSNVGTNVNTDEVYWDTTYPGYTAGLKADSGWAADGNPAVVFTAMAMPPATPVNLRLNGTQACGFTTNVNYITPTWDGVSGAVSYNYKVTLNGVEIVPSTNVGNVTSVSGAFGGEGLSTFSVQAVAANGLTSGWATPCEVTYDKTAPAAPKNLALNVTSTGLVIPNNSTTDKTDVTASWENGGNEVVSYIYKYWNDVAGNPYKIGSEYPVQTSGTSYSGAINQGGNGDTHHFCVIAVDAAGNQSACTGPYTFTYDTTPVINPGDDDEPGDNETPTGTGSTTNGGSPSTPAGQVTQLSTPTPLPLTSSLAVLTPGIAPAVPATADDEEEVLGTQTERDSFNDTAVKGSSTVAKANSFWDMLGLAWYWWLLIAAIVAGFVWWMIAALRRRNQDA